MKLSDVQQHALADMIREQLQRVVNHGESMLRKDGYPYNPSFHLETLLSVVKSLGLGIEDDVAGAQQDLAEAKGYR